MNQERKICDFCGAWISPEKFRQGLAVVVLRQTYCPACMKDAVRRRPPKPATLPPPPPSLRVEVATPSPVVSAAPPKTRRVKAGEHGCGLYATEDERRAQLAPFLREGLEKREKVLQFVLAPSPERILADFRAVGLPAQTYLKSGQLQVRSASKLLDPAGGLESAVELAVAQGYAGLRIAAELTWMLNSMIDRDRLNAVESQLEALATRPRCAVLCQYNVVRFEASSLQLIHKRHPVLLARGMAETMLKELAGAT